MTAILRCVSGVLRRCLATGKILRCGEEVQWQTPYTNSGCGTCSGGVFPGNWTAGTPVLSTDVDSDAAGSVVIDADAGTAVSYGAVYGTGTAPGTPDTNAPTVTSAPCSCAEVFYVFCRTAYSSVQSCAPGFYSGGNVESVGTSDICPDDDGCSEDESPPYWVCDGCTYINAIPATGRCNKVIAGPFCTNAEANTWITDNCGSGGVLDQYYNCCNASPAAQDPRCP